MVYHSTRCFTRKTLFFQISFVISLLFSFSSLAQVTYFSATSGNWNAPGTWSTDNCGSGVNTGTFPKAGDNAVICHNVTINLNVNIENVTVNNGGDLTFEGAAARTLTVEGNLNVIAGGRFGYSSNNSLKHIAIVKGNLENNGTIEAFSDANDYIIFRFEGVTNSIISGSGSWSLFDIVINKDTRPVEAEIISETFYNSLNSGDFTLTRGTYVHNNSNTFNMGTDNNFTINSNSIVKIMQGILNFASTASTLTLEGGLDINGGTVNVGRTNGTGPNAGLRYKSGPGGTPFLNMTSGLLMVYQGFKEVNNTSPVIFTMSGGIIRLNEGTNASSAETFKIADLAASSFNMSDGSIIIKQSNSKALTDFDVGGTAGSVSSTGGTIQFGDVATIADTFNFTPYPNKTLPNIKVTGPAANQIILKPTIAGNFRFISLYIDTGKIFESASNFNGYENPTMTLTGTFDGNFAFYDNNNSSIHTFQYRSGTVVLLESSEIKVNTGGSLKRFFNLSCAFPGKTNNINNDLFIERKVIINGGTLTSTSLKYIYLYHDLPLSITAGSVISVYALVYAAEDISQELPGYVYNCGIYIGGNLLKTINQMGPVTCEFFSYNFGNVNQTGTYLTNNHNLTINQDFTVGTGASTKLKEVRFGTSVVTIHGNLLIDKDGAVDAGSSTIYLHGNWTNRSTLSPLFKEDLCTVIMTGINSQTIENPTETERFYKMIIDKAYLDVTLKSTISIQSSLTFTLGRIFSTSTNKLIFLTSANTIGAKDGSFVHGPVQRNGAGDFDFPVGKDTYYRPITISPTGPNTDAFTAEYFNTDPDPLYSTSSIGAGIASVSRCEYWSLVRNAGTTNTKVRLSYNSQSCYPTEYSTFKVLSWTGSLWKDEGRANFTGDAIKGSVESVATTTNYTAYTLMSCVPPIINVDGPLSFCSGDSVKLTAPVSEQYAWTNGSTAQSIFVKTSGAFTVTTWKGVCTRTSPEVIVDVLPAPPLPDVTADSNCGPGSVTLVATNSPDGYRWYETSTGGTSVDSNANFTTPVISVSTIYYVSSISAGGCESTIRTAVEAIIHALPDIPVITSKINCGPGSVLLEATSTETKYAWYGNEDKTIVLSATGSTYTTPVLDTTTSYFVGAVTENNCESKPLVKVTVTIDSIPDRPKPFFVSRCGPGSVKLELTEDTAKFSWYTTKENGTPIEDSAVFITPDLSEHTKYYVAAKTNLGCESEERAEVNVYVNPIPEQPLINDTGRCGRGAMNIAVSGPASTINWYDKNSIFIINDSVLKIADLSSDSLFYVESITDSLCKSIQKEVKVFMYPVPGEPVVEDGSHCGPGDVLLKSTGSDNKYIWYNENLTKIDTIYTGEFLLKQLITTTKFFVSSVSEKGCKSVEKEINAFIREIPATPEAKPFFRCGPGTVNLSAKGSIYKYGWFAHDTTVVLSDSSNFSIPSVDKDTVFYVSSLSEFGCFSSRVAVPVEIKEAPENPVAVNGTRCGPGKVELSAVGSTTQYNWYTDKNGSPIATSGPLFITDSINITTTYYVKNVSSENCESIEMIEVTAIINEIPAMPDGEDVKRCGSGPVILSASGSVGDYLWYAADTTIDSLYSGPVFKIDSLYSSDTFYVESLSDKGCKSEGRKAINATILPLPAAPTVISDSTCGSGSLELRVVNQAGEFRWYENETTLNAFDSIPNIVTPVLSSSKDFYVVKLSADRCESFPRTRVRAIINPVPTAPTATIDRTLCGPDTLILTASGSPSTYSWRVNDSYLSETSASVTTPVLSSSISYFVYSVSSSKCISDSTEIKISYIDIPSVQTEEGKRCGPGSVELKASGSIGNYYWYETLNSQVPLDTSEIFVTPTLSESKSYYVTTQTYETCKTKGRSEVKANIIAVPVQPEVEDAFTCDFGKVTIKAKDSTLLYYWFDENRNKLSEESFQYTTSDLSANTTFFLKAFSQNCESPEKEVLVRVHAKPADAAASDISICANSSGTLSASESTGLYNWYEDDNTETIVSKNQEFNLPTLTETKTYYLAARDSFCVSGRIPVVVEVKPAPETPIAVDGFSCGPGKVDLSVSGSAVNYFWYNSQNAPNHFKEKSSTHTTGLLTADSTYFVEAVSEIGCKSNRVPVTATISETSIGGKTITQGTTTVCGGSNGNVIQLSGYKGSILRWETSSNNFATTPQSISVTSEMMFYSNIRSTTYYRAIVKSGACEEIASSAVVINVVPSVVAGNIASSKTTVTKGSNEGEIILTGNVGEIIEWESSLLDTINFLPTDQTTAIHPFVNNTEDTYYRAKVSSATCGSKFTNIIKIMVKEQPFLFIDSITTTLNVPVNSDKSVLSNDYHPNDEPLVVPQPSEITTAAGGFIIIFPDGNFSYTPPQDYEGKDSVSYFVCLANLDAPICSNGKLIIRVKDETLKIFPTISPNGDKLNDEWIIDNINLYPDNQVTIFDRWGNPVFEEKGYDNKNKVWKGRSNKNFVIGESELPEGTYFYVINLGANMKVRNGYIVLKR